MRFVPIKTADQQAAGMVPKSRELLVRQRSQTANALRAHMAELGIVAAAGMASITKLAAHIRDDSDERIPAAARLALIELTEQIEMLTARIRSEEHTSELQSLMRISYAVFCLKKKKKRHNQRTQLT